MIKDMTKNIKYSNYNKVGGDKKFDYCLIFESYNLLDKEIKTF